MEFPEYHKAVVNVKLVGNDCWFPSAAFNKRGIASVHIENPGEYYTSRDEQMVFWKGQGDCVLLFCLDNFDEVVIPEGVTEIGHYAFSRNHLASVTIPNTVTIIHGSAFAGCTKLKHAVLSDHLEKIEGSAFAESRIEEIYLPGSLESLGGHAFADCKHLRTVRTARITDNETPDSYEIIPNIAAGTFDGCSNLREVPQNFGNISIPEKKPNIITTLTSKFSRSSMLC